MVIPVPFFHCFGMVIGVIATVSHGSLAVIPARSFEPVSALRAVAATGATSLYGVPAMFIAMLARPEADELDLSTLRTGVMAGSTCPVEVMKKVIDRFHMSEVAICYGMTETAPVSTMTRRDDSLEVRTQTVGRTMPHVETKIVDPATGDVVPRGATGELCTRGYSVMLGYWDAPEKTAEVLDADGWMHSGDLASMDEDGSVRIEGRIKELEMIISRAEVIDPAKLSGSVKFGAKVTVVDEDTDEEKTFQLVGEQEADLERGLLNVRSPLARALIGKDEGDSVEVTTPGGLKSYEILSIRYE